jgi:hypothetical protein
MFVVGRVVFATGNVDVKPGMLPVLAVTVVFRKLGLVVVDGNHVGTTELMFVAGSVDAELGMLKLLASVVVFRKLGLTVEDGKFVCLDGEVALAKVGTAVVGTTRLEVDAGAVTFGNA